MQPSQQHSPFAFGQKAWHDVRRMRTGIDGVYDLARSPQTENSVVQKMRRNSLAAMSSGF